MLRAVHHPGLQSDVEQLPTSELQLVAIDILAALENGELLRAKRLGHRKNVADLRGWWAVKFDDPTIALNRYRLIFRYLPSDWDRREIQFLAIGLRFENQVYKLAGHRLN